ncbi:MAG: hypothetical protein CMB45_06345 [Euryarchaeota archaeon]|nr:hypothetical protein [Euryarchaeota archaeon]
MRSSFAHRHNTAFARSSSLGEIHAAPVIEEVTMRRGNGATKTIVKDGKIFQQNFGYRRHDIVTVKAKLIGKGYFYATSVRGTEEYLLFVTPVYRKLNYPLQLEIPLEGLNFHISPTIPTHLNTTYLDGASRLLLRSNPSAYSSLGFMPSEPKTQPTQKMLEFALKNPLLKHRYEGIEIDETWDENTWHGEVATHSWRYGRTGTEVTRGEDIKWIQNYDGGWCAGGSIYKYVPGKGWETFQQSQVVAQVGQPHCIVLQMVGYKDTAGIGGEYHYYQGNGRSSTNTTWKYGDRYSGSKIRIMNLDFAHAYGDNDHGKNGEVNFQIQDYYAYGNGGELISQMPGGTWLPTSEHEDGIHSDKFCAKVEWWNPENGQWSAPAIHPPFTANITGSGKFAFYFRFPRQLTKEDEYYEKTPQWKILNEEGTAGTYDCYPKLDTDMTTPVYKRIGRPTVSGGTGGIEVEIAGKKLQTSDTSPYYYVMICPESKSDDGKRNATDNQKRSYIPISNFQLRAVDPFAYSYSDNPDILKAYWKNGTFKPGGSFMLMGKAADFFQGYWVSKNSLKTKNATPMDLSVQQYDYVRGEIEPNTYDADRVSNYRYFKATDITDPKKVQKFQDSWDACFPGVPFTKDILVAMIRGDQLPELEGINYEQLPGFLEDDPLRYEVTYQGVKYRHPYSLVFCQLPEGWWGPTVGNGSDVQSLYFGGVNWYNYIFEEKVDMAAEIAAQLALEEAGLTAAEQFAASELENPMTDITFEAYKNRNETVKESVNEDPQDEIPWWRRTEQVLLKHRKVALLGSVGTVTDVTDRYSADHITSLDGVNQTNLKQYNFNDLYLVQGMGNTPSMVIMPPKEPSSGVPLKVSNESGFGNSERQALKARALGNGNPMKYSTEAKQDSIQVEQMGGILNDVIPGAEEAVKSAVTVGAIGLGTVAFLGLALKVGPYLRKSKEQKLRLEEQELRTAKERMSFADQVKAKINAKKKNRKK